MARVGLLILITVSLALIAGCGGSDESGDPPANPSGASPTKGTDKEPAPDLSELLKQAGFEKKDLSPDMKLSGDKAADKANILARLKAVQVDVAAIRKDHDRYVQSGKQPPEAVVMRHEKQLADLNARAAALQKLLEQIDK